MIKPLSPWSIPRNDVEAAMEVYRSLRDAPAAKRSDVVGALFRMQDDFHELNARMLAEPLPEPAPE